MVVHYVRNGQAATKISFAEHYCWFNRELEYGLVGSSLSSIHSLFQVEVVASTWLAKYYELVRPWHALTPIG